MAQPTETRFHVPLDQLRPSALNPRRTASVAADQELLESIRAHTILTPLLVRPVPGDVFEIVAGHRRYAAAVELGFEAVPVVVRDLTDDEARQAAIIENLHRENLAPLDEAESYQALLDLPGATVASVAAAVGKSTAYIGRRLKLLGLIADAQDALRAGQMDVARAELLAKLDEDAQAEALDSVVWLDLFARPADGADRDGPRTAAALCSLADLRRWVDQRTRLSLDDLVHDPETMALFPEASEALAENETAHAPEPLLEVALDHDGSPKKSTVPPGVRRLNTHFREVTGTPCASARRAIVVFGTRKGEVVVVCPAKKDCQTHWPSKANILAGSPTAPRRTWQEEEAERKRVAQIWERVRPAAVQAAVQATAKIKTTPAILLEALRQFFYSEASEALKATGTRAPTPATFGRLYVLAKTLRDYYQDDSAARALKKIGSPFNVAKAMREAEAAMKAKPKTPEDETKRTSAATKQASAKKAGRRT